MYFQNNKGNLFRSGIGGTYPVNNGDPQCDLSFPEEDEDEEECFNTKEDEEELEDI